MELQNVVLQTILERRSTRSFTDEPVAAEQLSQLLQAGLHAPSGGNHQLVRLFVMQNPERIERLNGVIRDLFAARPLDPSVYQNKSAIRARQPGCHFFFHAPVLISALSPRTHANSMADSANALQNIQIAAAALGLGACWINQPHWLTDQPALRALFAGMGMTEQEDIFGSVIVGHPAHPKPPPLPRKEGRIVYE